MGNDASRTLAIACMLLASRDKANDGSFNGDPEYVKRFAYLNTKPDFKQLIQYEFIEVLEDASKTLAPRNTETEAYKEEGEKRQRKKALSPDYHPKEEHYDLAESVGINLDYEIQVFKDHWKANGEKKIDWDATLRNWIKRAAGYAAKNKPSQSVQEARLNVANQIMGGTNGTKRQIIDINERPAIEGNGESVPKAAISFRKPDAG